jgi:hypothetical protein
MKKSDFLYTERLSVWDYGGTEKDYSILRSYPTRLWSLTSVILAISIGTEISLYTEPMIVFNIMRS